MTLHLWLAFLITATSLSLVPGPAVLYVIGSAARHGAASGVASGLGILGGNVVWFAASALGLATLVAIAAPLFVAIKWLGVVYLTWLGLRAWRDAMRKNVATRERPAIPQRARLWRNGIWLQLANPKAILFFTALLPQFVDTRGAIAPQIAVLAVTSLVSEFFVLAGYAWLTARGSALLVARPGFARAGDAAAGTCLVGAGLGLALSGSTR